MKLSTLFRFSFFLAVITFSSCGSSAEEEATGVSTFQIDSAFAAQEKAKKDAPPPDTAAIENLPAVLEGDLIFQISTNPKAKALQIASGSKYSNVGILLTNPRNGKFVVIDALDSIHATELKEWVNKGEGGHFAVMRMKNSNRILGEGKTKKLKQKVKEMKPIPFDPYINWGNDAFYSSEFVWKLYSKVLYIDLCEPGLLNTYKLSNPEVKKITGDKYAKGVSDTIKAVSPGDIYHSPKLDLIYER